MVGKSYSARNRALQMPEFSGTSLTQSSLPAKQRQYRSLSVRCTATFSRSWASVRAKDPRREPMIKLLASTGNFPRLEKRVLGDAFLCLRVFELTAEPFQNSS